MCIAVRSTSRSQQDQHKGGGFCKFTEKKTLMEVCLTVKVARTHRNSTKAGVCKGHTWCEPAPRSTNMHKTLKDLFRQKRMEVQQQPTKDTWNGKELGCPLPKNFGDTTAKSYLQQTAPPRASAAPFHHESRIGKVEINAESFSVSSPHGRRYVSLIGSDGPKALCSFALSES